MRKLDSAVCLLVSGGLDSGFLLSQLLAEGVRVTPVYLRCGFIWEKAELYWLRKFLRVVRNRRLSSLIVIDMPGRLIYGRHWSVTGRLAPAAGTPSSAVYLPGRNVLLISQASVLCARDNISTIVIGVVRGNPFRDATASFLAELASCLSAALGKTIRIVTPLRRNRKVDLIRRASNWPVHLTFSCLRPRGRLHCGRCNKCAERRRAFEQAGESDPTKYVR